MPLNWSGPSSWLQDRTPSWSGRAPLKVKRSTCVVKKDRVSAITSFSASIVASFHTVSYSSTTSSSERATHRRMLFVTRCRPSMPAAAHGRHSAVITGLLLKNSRCCTAPHALIEAKPVQWARSTAKHSMSISRFSARCSALSGSSSDGCVHTAPEMMAKAICMAMYHTSMWIMSTSKTNVLEAPSSTLASIRWLNVWKTMTAQKMEIVWLMTS
mmetsp:Transcript_101032/g.261123  ORF Transcript_101032/g.261123 Transcript_101032/m.261123 type:complete len:214 (-) Transcript_101032:90-731(-)